MISTEINTRESSSFSLIPSEENGLMKKLEILSDSAKYDVACTSSGSDRKNVKGGIGNTKACGICHSFSADGRCISLLKVLMSNDCSFDCEYCVNRLSNDFERVTFEPKELANLTYQFYRRNYIEGLFLSSAVYKNSNYSSELMLQTIKILRYEYKFMGYIHVKAIPGTSEHILHSLGTLCDRMSVNIEFPSKESLSLFAPQKSKQSILKPMSYIKSSIEQSKYEIVKYKHAKSFSTAGQATQMIVGASPESDFQILKLTEALYKKFSLKRVFFSAYIPVSNSKNLPSPLNYKPPLLREHRLYQADWLLRFYGFNANEILNEKNQNFNPDLDPKCNWAINNFDKFPMEINKADYENILRIPGIGVLSARRIMVARRHGNLDFSDLKKIGVVLKRAKYFITCNGKYFSSFFTDNTSILSGILKDKALPSNVDAFEQLSFFTKEDGIKSLTGQI